MCVGIDIQFGLEDGEVYRATSFEFLPFRLKYLAIPEIRWFMRQFMFGWMDDENPDYYSEIAKSFVIPEFDVGFQEKI